MALFQGLFSKEKRALLRKAQGLVPAINALEERFSGLSDNDLRAHTELLKKRLTDGGTPDDVLPEAFAVVREAAKRTLKQRHFDVQLIGGAVLHWGGIAEMKTGEGKTLVATLPTYLNALLGKGVHVVTVNDYLARRDAIWMGQIYSMLGLTVGVINHDASYLYDPGHLPAQAGTDVDTVRDELGSFKVVHEFLRPATRRDAYTADITYGTNSEFGFDYLRDNTEYSPQALRQRERHFAIVDEIDSILIDEARTPLIISAPAAESEHFYVTFAKVAESLERDRDFTVDEKLKAIQLTDDGIARAEKLLGIDNIYTERGVKYVHHLETAVRAKALYNKDKDYVIKEGEVVIVDEFTGRLQPGRRWSEGLHQAIEAKEGVPIQRESRTLASISYQNYFRLYTRLAGMTGTAATSSEEFYKVYGLEVVEIPTNKPVVRKDHNDLIFQTEKGKFKALARRVKELQGKGQPVLIGTASVEKNELLSTYLRADGISHEVLNAKNHEREGEIIAQAGKKGKVTVATNLAGRGVDIKLGGNPATPEEYEEIKTIGGLYVVGTERHEARRIDNQLRGRSGRQGDPGGTQFFVSLEDSLMRVFAADAIKRMMGRFGIPEDEPIENSLITRALESAQTKIEGFHFDARKHVLAYDDVLNLQRKTIYDRRHAMLTGTNEEVWQVIKEWGQGDEEGMKAVEAKRAELQDQGFFEVARRIILQTIDMFWIEHLEAMDYMRGSVNLRAYGQRDPLIEYRKEGLQLFKRMEEDVAGQVFRLVPFVGKDSAQMTSSRQLASVTPVAVRPRGEEKLGRNDPCPCGSGKKYKKCGMLNTAEHQDRMKVKK